MTDAPTPKLPGKYVEVKDKYDEDCSVYTLYSDGVWYRNEEPVHEAAVPKNLARLFALSPTSQDLLSRAALNLAKELDEWHGGPDEMYEEAEELRALAAHLSVDVTQKN